MLPIRVFAVIAAITCPLFAEQQGFTVTETVGLRRFGYPVTASLEFASGRMTDATTARLVDAQGREVPAQLTIMSRWPDGTVRGLDVDFAPSLGPKETQSYAVELGTGPTSPVKGGLSVIETPDELTVASAAIRHRIRRDGRPLLTSIAFGDNEFIGTEGVRTTLSPGPVEITKRGPFNVTLRMGPVTLEYVSTKSWVKIVQRAESVQELHVDAHFHLAKRPLLWDFGVGHWLYGTLPRAGQVALIQHRQEWEVRTGEQSLFATSPTFDGCGHLADAERVAAFGVVDSASDLAVTLDADGRVQIRSDRQSLTTFFHVIGQPIPVTAVTSPQAMISPLAVARATN